MRVQVKGAYNEKAKPMAVGVSHLTNWLKWDWYLDTTSGYKSVSNWTWQAAPWLIVGGSEDIKSITDPLSNIKGSLGFAGHFEKSLQWGLCFNYTAAHISTPALNSVNHYFNHTSGNKTVGAEMNYDVDKKTYGCKVGLALKQDDHTWKFRLHESGLARAALQWQMHKVCKTTIDTSVDVKSALNGSITGLPLGMTFDVTY